MDTLKGLGARVKRVTLAVAAAGLLQAGSSLAALQLRDLNGNPTANAAIAEFAYDTVLDATWYLTANNTGLPWNAAKAWAAGLTVGAFSGWSLPSADPACANGYPAGSPLHGYNCSGGQIGELYYTALGNRMGGPLANTGPFKNLLGAQYWSGTEEEPLLETAWFFNTRDGYQSAYGKNGITAVLAVRPGDVAAVPEASTWAMLLLGLVVVGVVGVLQPR
ncbi:MAG: PEP-CTERM sorting domain-containing protein [Betaproteobacteria bacterium]